MPPDTSAVYPRPVRGTAVRHASLACLFLSLLLPLVAVVATWGLPVGRTVYITADGREHTFRSFRRTVGDAVESAQIALAPGDRLKPPSNTLLWPGARIRVIRAVPATVRVDGSIHLVRVAATTVGGALDVLGIPVGRIDRVYPDPATPLVADTQITIERREWRAWIEERPVAFASQVVADPQLFKGNRVVRTVGHPGITRRVTKALYANGSPVAMVPQAWMVVRPATPQVVGVGTRAMIVARGQFAGREYMRMEATAYYSGPNNYGGAIGPYTAIGMLAQRGVVAVDPSVIPLGSRLYIEGYGYAVAGDTGGAIQGMKIDLCFNTYDEAIHFGRQPVKVYILERR